MTDPVNLIDTLEPDSSLSYVRRVVARILGHAIAEGLTWDEAKILWIKTGYDPDRWYDYRNSIKFAAGA